MDVTRSDCQVGLPGCCDQLRQIARVVGKISIHLHDRRSSRIQGTPEAGEVCRAEPLLALAVEHLEVAAFSGEAVGDLAGAVGGGIVDHEDPVVFGESLTDGLDQSLDVLGLIEGREYDPNGRLCRIGHFAIVSVEARGPGTPTAVGSVRRVTNKEIAEALKELAILYELDGADRYRILAYENAASTIADWPQSLEQMADEGKLQDLPGVGETLAAKIGALIDTGSIPAADELKKRIPEGLIAVTHLPGLGAKTAARLNAELGIDDLESLRSAAEQGKIRELKGMGPKAEANILDGLDALGGREPADSQRVLLSKVLPVSDRLIADLSEHPACIRIEPGGSVRRQCDTCHDLDLVASTEDPEGLIAAFVANPQVSRVEARGEAGASVVTGSGIKVDLRLTDPSTYGNLLQHFSGSMDHNVELRELARRKNLSVSEHGVTETGKRKRVHRFEDEEGVYRLLGLDYIEPELREGRGEIEAAQQGTLPDLVDPDRIRGDLHAHTTLSDGKDSLTAMAEAAQAKGYAYLAITDHSASHGFGNGVDEKALRKRIAEIERFNAKAPKGFRLLSGSEVNILPDGSLDYPDDLLKDLDWVIASIHTSFGKGREAMTERLVSACEHPWVDCIGHPTGRLLLERDPYPLDIEAVVESAAATGTMLEINGAPKRRDLSDQHARLAADAGVKLVVNTDAHSVESLDFMKYAVATARRGWLTLDDVANSRPWRSFAPLRKRHGK